MAIRESKAVELTATMLCEKLQGGDRQYFEWYCKVAYLLSEAKIQSILEVAVKANHPGRYFSGAAKREIAKAENH